MRMHFLFFFVDQIQTYQSQPKTVDYFIDFFSLRLSLWAEDDSTSDVADAHLNKFGINSLHSHLKVLSDFEQ